MGQPRISVLVPTYNRAPFIRDCLESLLGQTLPPVQLLVVDDASTDATADVLDSLDHRIEVISTPNVGKPSAVNIGLDRVIGDFLWIFDDDDVALPDALERYVEPLEANSRFDYSFGKFWYTPTCEDGRLDEPSSVSTIPELSTRGPLVPLLEANYLGGATLFARVSCYKKVGYFDPTLLRSQDYEMAIRLVRRFYGVQIRGGPTFHYRQHDGLRGSGADRFEAKEREAKWLEYDQRFFRRLYRTLSLAEYLGPGLTVETHRRAALLQRAVVMASKDLIDEVIEDLERIGAGQDQSTMTPSETLLVERGLATPSWYGEDVLTDPNFVWALRRLARRSHFIGEMKRILRTLAWRKLDRDLIRPWLKLATW